MLNNETLFIIGAGAGVDFKFPLGIGLRDTIKKIVFEAAERPDKGQISNAIRVLSHRDTTRQNKECWGQYVEACRAIARGMSQTPSIDNFIHMRNDPTITACAKVAIIGGILQHESTSTIFQGIPPSNINLNAAKDTWLEQFWNILSTNVQIEEIPRIFDNLYIVNFNYDRLIEHFLFHSLMNTFGITYQSASTIMRGLNIVHPYGTVGPLPWQEGYTIDFGQTPDSNYLLSAIGNLNTFTEGLREENEKKIIEKYISIAKSIICLGFAFHKINTELLSISRDDYFGTNLYATVLGEPQPRVLDISENIRRALKIPKSYQVLENLNCSQLLNHYSTKFTDYLIRI